MNKQEMKQVKKLFNEMIEEKLHEYLDEHIREYIVEQTREMITETIETAMVNHLEKALEKADRVLDDKVNEVFEKNSSTLIQKKIMGAEDVILTAIHDMMKSSNFRFNEYARYGLVPKSRVYLHIRQKRKLREVFRAGNLRITVRGTIDQMVQKGILYEKVPMDDEFTRVVCIGINGDRRTKQGKQTKQTKREKQGKMAKSKQNKT